MVKSEINGVITYYVGRHYEKQVDGVTETLRKYYTASGKTLAMRENGTLTWLLSDHLGSTSVTADASGNLVSSLRYTAFGEIRAASGTTGTDYLYTGQREESELGLYYYVARWYDPSLARFIQADSIVPQPGKAQAWDRYAYVNNNPINATDPTGHMVADDLDGGCGLPGCTINPTPQDPPQEPSLPIVSQPEYTYVPVMTSNQGLTWKAVPLKKPTPITDFVKDRIPGSSTTWGYASTTLDVLAWITDLYAAGVVTYGGIAGAGITSPFILAGLPEVPVATGWAGAAIAELYAQPVLRLGNILATASTTATYISETKAGKTVVEIGQISNVTKNSASLTGLGWVAPSEAYISFVFQSAAILNDFGVTSIPFR